MSLVKQENDVGYFLDDPFDDEQELGEWCPQEPL